eukprot:TRINITY_DN7911_c0_g1_i4.p1 TRINITY_DN7911_c0_g1~~TRINITY_DN7911_c0_g1_i4.p1  ORF type:complete len:127 (-),score=18.27 TRINITY_DN7911_c0_g1_i4:287-667(-)
MVVGGNTRDMIDPKLEGNYDIPKLEGNYDINSIQEVIEIARACTKQKAVERPTGKDVVVELKERPGNEKTLESASESGVCACTVDQYKLPLRFYRIYPQGSDLSSHQIADDEMNFQWFFRGVWVHA